MECEIFCNRGGRKAGAICPRRSRKISIPEALERNAADHLSSIDYSSFGSVLARSGGWRRCERPSRARSYVEGPACGRLPGVACEAGQLDMVITIVYIANGRALRTRPACGRCATRRGIVVDDIDANAGFHFFNRDLPGHPSFVCEAEPFTKISDCLTKRLVRGYLKMPPQNRS